MTIHLPNEWLNLQNNLAINWQMWDNAYEFEAVASGASSKAETVQCSRFLHVAHPESTPNHEHSETKLLVQAFKE